MGKGWIARRPRGLIAAVVLVITVEAVVAGKDEHLTRPESWTWRFTRGASTTEVPGCEVLVFGTSMAQEGVLPRVVEQRTGWKSYNLAVGGGRTVYAYYFLRAALAAGARPRAAVIDVHPGFMAGSNYKNQTTGWSDVLGTADAVDMAWTVRDASFLAATLSGKVLPSLRNRHTIRSAVVARLEGREWSHGPNNRTFVRNFQANSGALVVQRNPAYRGEVTEVYRGLWLGPDRPDDPVELLYLDRFLRLAHEHGIHVYALMMPLAPGLQEEREKRGHDARFERFMTRLARRPGLTVVDARRSGYRHDVFMDAAHLDPQGAFILSDELARVIGAGTSGTPAPAAESWVRLAPYRERAIDVPLEDAAASSVALTRRGRALR